MCGGKDEGGKNSCNGDYGGPVVWMEPETKISYLVGVISWEYSPCGAPKSPGVYARVTHYLPWIKENTGKATFKISDTEIMKYLAQFDFSIFFF